MSSYRMDIKGSVNLSDYSSIYDYISIVKKEDSFIITTEDNNKNIELICSLLERSDFIIKSKGVFKDGRNYISAYRKSQQESMFSGINARDI